MNRTDAQIGYRRINMLGLFFSPATLETPSMKRWKQARNRAVRSLGMQHWIRSGLFK